MELIKEIIQKSNPSILDIKVGCKILFSGHHHQDDYAYEPETITEILNTFTVKTDWGEERNLGSCEIIGRDIMLSDVFNAMDGYLSEKKYSVFLDLIRLWNLKKVGLDNQSDECKQFIIKLLKKGGDKYGN